MGWPGQYRAMRGDGGLIGREHEVSLLKGALAGLANGQGGVILLSGEAGVGKTALAEAVLRTTPHRVLRGTAYPGAMAPYEPLTVLLGDPAAYLAVSGDDARTADPDGARMAVLATLRQTAEREPTVVFLDDLHWADAATLEVMERWAPNLAATSVLLLAAYRADGLPRRHPLRRLRAQLRRGPALSEVVLASLEAEATAELVARRVGATVPANLARVIHDRSQGLPFYVEALADAVAAELAADPDAAVSVAASVVPERVQDAALLRLDDLGAAPVELAEIVAAATRLPYAVAMALSDPVVVELLHDRGLLVDATSGPGEPELVFRHALIRDALYAATPWTRRRAHHRLVAQALADHGAAPYAVATQWLAAGAEDMARSWLVSAAQAACRVHAYEDARKAIRTALTTWAADQDPAGRLAALELWARCAERSGELDDAIAALEGMAAHHADGGHASVGDVQRRMAGIHEMRGDVAAAMQARAAALAAFDRSGQARDAAAERLVIAEQLEAAGQLTEADRLVAEAIAQLPPDEVPLRARALGLRGTILGSLGDSAKGVQLAREGLDLALSANLAEVTAEAYYLWAISLEHACRYPDTLEAYAGAFDYCASHGVDATAQLCLACLAPSLRRTGRWEQAVATCQDVLANAATPEPARVVARAELGLILAARGKAAPARRQLTAALALAEPAGIFGAEIEAAWGLAQVEATAGQVTAAAERLSRLVRRCAEREERHFAIAPLRWASAFFGQHGLRGELAACIDVLSEFAGITGASEAVAAMAAALAESALLDGDVQRAIDGLERALDLLGPLDLPPEKAEVEVRCGAALARAGDRARAIERLVASYYVARNLQAGPLATTAARHLADLGEDVGKRLGPRAARDLGHHGLTRREMEVLHQVARGHTNREVGQELFISTRTVDMHVRNVLAKLGCRSRMEAVRRAAELGLVPFAPANTAATARKHGDPAAAARSGGP